MTAACRVVADGRHVTREADPHSRARAAPERRPASERSPCSQHSLNARPSTEATAGAHAARMRRRPLAPRGARGGETSPRNGPPCRRRYDDAAGRRSSEARRAPDVGRPVAPAARGPPAEAALSRGACGAGTAGRGPGPGARQREDRRQRPRRARAPPPPDADRTWDADRKHATRRQTCHVDRVFASFVVVVARVSSARPVFAHCKSTSAGASRPGKETYIAKV